MANRGSDTFSRCDNYLLVSRTNILNLIARYYVTFPAIKHTQKITSWESLPNAMNNNLQNSITKTTNLTTKNYLIFCEKRKVKEDFKRLSISCHYNKFRNPTVQRLRSCIQSTKKAQSHIN